MKGDKKEATSITKRAGKQTSLLAFLKPVAASSRSSSSSAATINRESARSLGSGRSGGTNDDDVDVHPLHPPHSLLTAGTTHTPPSNKLLSSSSPLHPRTSTATISKSSRSRRRRVTPDNNNADDSNNTIGDDNSVFSRHHQQELQADPQQSLEASLVVGTTSGSPTNNGASTNDDAIISSPLRDDARMPTTTTTTAPKMPSAVSFSDDVANSSGGMDSDGEDDNNDNGNNNNSGGLSDYELLRLRNIERNNARLAALGLLTTTMTTMESSLSSRRNNNKPKPSNENRRRKRPSASVSASTSSSRQLPVRRSTRQRKEIIISSSSSSQRNLTTNSRSNNTNDAPEEQAATASASFVENNATCSRLTEQQEESYTVSPLMQYAMSTTTSTTKSGLETESEMLGDYDDLEDECTSLTLRPIRLVPPNRLGAIYSLQFYGGGSRAGTCSSSQQDETTNPQHCYPSWIVGAGKAGVVAVWDASAAATTVGARSSSEPNEEEEKPEQGDDEYYASIDPILSWKAHNGRWIAEARFLQTLSSSSLNAGADSTTTPPSRLLTAANDGAVCLWDLTTVSAQDAVPKLLMRTGKELHSSGIFSLDVLQNEEPAAYGGTTSGEVSFATASKDKTIAISTLGAVEELGWWSSHHHSAKVGDVRFRGKGTSLLASVGDDGVVAIHDYRTNRIVGESSQAHNRPHSVVWNPTLEHVFMTAGHDKTIKLWDLRRFGDRSTPIGVLEGHIPVQETRCKKIHRPIFYQPRFAASSSSNDSSFVLTGGQNSHSLSVFHSQGINGVLSQSNLLQQGSPTVRVSLRSRGRLPEECGDAVCIAVDGNRVAVSTDQAEVLLLQPTRKERTAKR